MHTSLGTKRPAPSNPELADKYIEHTLIGDPAADTLVNAIAAADQEQQAEFIRAGMDEDEEALRAAPQEVREFFDRD